MKMVAEPRDNAIAGRTTFKLYIETAVHQLVSSGGAATPGELSPEEKGRSDQLGPEQEIDDDV